MNDTPIIRELRLLPPGPVVEAYVEGPVEDPRTGRSVTPTPDVSDTVEGEPTPVVSQFFGGDATVVDPLPGDQHFVHDPPPDDDLFIRRVLTQRRTWPVGAKVGDGTAGPGRKPTEVDDRIVMAMATVGATVQEIADFVGVSAEIIRLRFGDQIKYAKASRKIRLRQAQWSAALDGNTTMQIWLGKNELGQYDESRIKVGNLASYTDEELEQIAQGKVPGQLNSGKDDDDR